MTDINKLEDKVRTAVQPVEEFVRQNGTGTYTSELSVNHNIWEYKFSWVGSPETFYTHLVSLLATYLRLEEIKRNKELAEVYITNAIIEYTEDENTVNIYDADVRLDLRFND